MTDPRLSIIVAKAQNGVIGGDNKMLWHIPEDFKHFKTLTSGKPVIMGRKTYESILGHLGKPLPNRVSIVITRQADYKIAEDHFVVSSVDAALKKAKEVANNSSINEIFCIGGADIYKQMLQYSDRVYLTIIEKDFKGDASFPNLDENDWSLSDSKKGQEIKDIAYRFETWDRQ
jgi:dihydrofolate reductase